MQQLFIQIFIPFFLMQLCEKKWLMERNQADKKEFPEGTDKYNVGGEIKWSNKHTHELMKKKNEIEIRKKTHREHQYIYCPFGRGCRIHRLYLYRGVRPHFNECPGYDTNQSYGDVPVMLELCGMRSTPSFLSLPGPLRPGMVAYDKALSMD